MNEDVEQLLRAALRDRAGLPVPAGDPVMLVGRRIRRRSRVRWIGATVAGVVCVVGVAVGVNVLAASSPGTRPANPATTGVASPAPTVGSLQQPVALAAEPDGDLLIADAGRHQILRRLPDGELEVVAGTGTAGFSGDGGAAVEAEISQPAGMVVRADGTIDFVDGGNSIGNDRIRQISPSGVIHTIVGDGNANGDPSDPTDGERATSAAVADLGALAFGPDGDLYFTEYRQVDRLTAAGTIQIVVGFAGGQNVPITDPKFPAGLSPQAFDPTALAFDKTGALYLANASPKLLVKVTSGGVMSLVTGQVGGETYVSPGGLVGASDGSVLVADYGFALDRIVGGVLTTLTNFGSKIQGIDGYLRPIGVTVFADGTIYVVDDGTAGALTTPTLARRSPGGSWTEIR